MSKNVQSAEVKAHKEISGKVFLFNRVNIELQKLIVITKRISTITKKGWKFSKGQERKTMLEIVVCNAEF
jgi:hypothetical protein